MSMWRVLKTLFILEKSNKKNTFTIILVALFVMGMVLFLKTEDLGNLVKVKSNEFQSLTIALNKFQNVDATDSGNGSDLYKNLVRQQQYVVKQRMAIRMNRPELFVDTAIELANLRASSFEMEGFDQVSNYLPSKKENQLNSVFYHYINEAGISFSIPYAA